MSAEQPAPRPMNLPKILELLEDHQLAVAQAAVSVHCFGRHAPQSRAREERVATTKSFLLFELAWQNSGTPEPWQPVSLPTFKLNSVSMQIPNNPVFTYDDICNIAGRNPDCNPTVTWATGDKQGSLVHGEMLVVTPGVVINCLGTGNA